MFTHLPSPRPRHGRGFTLIELMIAVAVIAILATIALPSYRQYVLEARRGDGQTALQRIQLAQEKWRTNHDSFTTTLSDLDRAGDLGPAKLERFGEAFLAICRGD